YLLFISNGIRDFAIKNLSAPKEKCITIYISVNIDERFIVKNKQNDVCKLVTIGRLTWEKGFAYTLKALYDVKKKYGCNFKYYIIGDGNEDKMINYLIKKFELENKVTV
ncbi:MAG: glycosyltransferase, partial [Firmicutes bacterium]|nr:glycosyltransferase [Bacillota bacterium]